MSRIQIAQRQLPIPYVPKWAVGAAPKEGPILTVYAEQQTLRLTWTCAMPGKQPAAHSSNLAACSKVREQEIIELGESVGAGLVRPRSDDEMETATVQWNRYLCFDVADADECVEWRALHPEVQRTDDPALLEVFPLMPIGALAAYKRVRQIARLRIEYVDQFQQGRMEAARLTEREMTRLYNEIPRHLRAY